MSAMLAGTRPDEATAIVEAPYRERKRVVVIGGGFAGIAATRALRNADVDVDLIDRRHGWLTWINERSVNSDATQKRDERPRRGCYARTRRRDRFSDNSTSDRTGSGNLLAFNRRVS